MFKELSSTRFVVNGIKELAHPQFSKIFRKVPNAEGRVIDPFEAAAWTLWRAFACAKNQGGVRIWDSCSRAPKGGRSKVSPTRPSASEPGQRRVFFAIARPGRSLKRFHRPNLLAYDYMGFKDRTRNLKSSEVSTLLPQRGPYEASEGIYPVEQRKNWGGQVLKNLNVRNLDLDIENATANETLNRMHA